MKKSTHPILWTLGSLIFMWSCLGIHHLMDNVWDWSLYFQIGWALTWIPVIVLLVRKSKDEIEYYTVQKELKSLGYLGGE